MKPYYQDDLTTLYYANAMTIIPQLNFHSLLLTDPPYGLGRRDFRRNITWANKKRGAIVESKFRMSRTQQDEIVPQWLIDECIAKCSAAIIFGGNYYHLPPAKCWLIWDKCTGENDCPSCEIAWTNLDKGIRLIQHLWSGALRANKEIKRHPYQKPLRVIQWAIEQANLYSFSSILDPFAGSGTTLVAAKMKGFKSTGIEIKQNYCDLIIKRLKLVDKYGNKYLI